MMSVNNSYLNNIFKKWVKIFILFTVVVFYFVICVCVTANPNKITGTVNVYQAEDAVIYNGAVETEHAGYTGTGYVNLDNEVGSYIEWTVNEYAGYKNLTVLFANGGVPDRPMDIFVNGTLAADEFIFESTGDWTIWAEKTIEGVLLKSGYNTIRAVGTTSNSGPNFDILEVESLDLPPPQYSLTINISGSGSVGLDPPGGTYYEGTVVTLTASEDLDYPFSSWSGDISGSVNPDTIEMNSNKNVTAIFDYVPEPRILTVDIRGRGSVTLDPAGGSYDAGTVVTLTAIPDSGYEFIEWTDDLSGSETSAAITMDVHKDVTANFTGEQIKIALWGDSRENRDKANEQITKILLDAVTDWDMCVHTGDYTPGGSVGNWEKAINYPRAQELLYSGKFYMCTSNHDDVLSTYDQYTAGVLPTNSVNGKTHFYHHQEGNVHIVACDRYFTSSSVMQNWLDQTLDSINPDDWIIGFWHPPCYGDVTYKSSYLSNCRGWLNSLYSKGGDMIFHGHAHVYVRTYPLLPNETVDPSGMVHIVNGCGGASFKGEQPHTVHTAFTPYSGSFGCITFLTFENNTVYLETIDARDGKNMAVIDSWQWTRGPLSDVAPQEDVISEAVIPSDLKLLPNYPNPFNTSTYINYYVPKAGHVKLAVYDVQGRLVKTLVDGVQKTSEYREVWEAVDFSGRQLPSGMYLCRFQVGSHVETIKMMFIR